MLDFFDCLDAALEETRNSDRRLTPATAIEIQFSSKTIRLWNGTGTLYTPDGYEWIGWHNGDIESPQSYVEVPAISDPRDGTSPVYSVTLGYLDDEMFAKLKADDTETDNRKMLIGQVYLPEGATRALTPLGNVTRLTIKGSAAYRQKKVKLEDGSHKSQNTVTINAVGINAGRSRTSFSSQSYTVQKFRSREIHGVEDDEYGQFIAKLSTGMILKI